MTHVLMYSSPYIASDLLGYHEGYNDCFRGTGLLSAGDPKDHEALNTPSGAEGFTAWS